MRGLSGIGVWVVSGMLLISVLVYSQDQRVADSLSKIYESNTLQGEEKMELLHNLAFHLNNDFARARQYSQELIALASELGDTHYLQLGYLQLGNSYRLRGNYQEALNAYFKSRELAMKLGDEVGEGTALMTIADVYSTMDNHEKATEYYHQSINLLRKTGDSLALTKAISNLGDQLLTIDRSGEAMKYLKEGLSLSRTLDYIEGIAYNEGNIGVAYTRQEHYEQADSLLNQAIAMLEEHEDYYGIASFQVSLSELYEKRNDLPNALQHAQMSLDIARAYGLKEQIGQANLQLSKLYEKAGDQKASLEHFREHIAYRDSIRNLESVQQMANMQADYEVSQKQIEVDLLNQRQRTQRIIVIATIIALLFIGVLAFVLYRRNQFIQKTKKMIEEEQKRSDSLLLNILPRDTAQELKEYGKVHAKKYDSVTVMFTDFKGFTRSSEHLSPEELVENVDYYFSRFDKIIEKYGLEKIKTMGDSYMCAGGLHFSMEDHATKMVMAAFEILEYVENVKKDNKDNKMCFDIRIGINTGPVVAGVVGTTKFAYDIWGDTVNVAARMEFHSEPGNVNISENTHAIIKDTFDCEYRGIIDVKNRGNMKMYYVKSLREARADHVKT